VYQFYFNKKDDDTSCDKMELSVLKFLNVFKITLKTVNYIKLLKSLDVKLYSDIIHHPSDSQTIFLFISCVQYLPSQS